MNKIGLLIAFTFFLNCYYSQVEYISSVFIGKKKYEIQLNKNAFSCFEELDVFLNSQFPNFLTKKLNYKKKDNCFSIDIELINDSVFFKKLHFLSDDQDEVKSFNYDNQNKYISCITDTIVYPSGSLTRNENLGIPASYLNINYLIVGEGIVLERITKTNIESDTTKFSRLNIQDIKFEIQNFLSKNLDMPSKCKIPKHFKKFGNDYFLSINEEGNIEYSYYQGVNHIFLKQLEDKLKQMNGWNYIRHNEKLIKENFIIRLLYKDKKIKCESVTRIPN